MKNSINMIVKVDHADLFQGTICLGGQMRYWGKAWSLVEGCTPVSESCENCWLASISSRFRDKTFVDPHGKFRGVIKIHEDRLDIPCKRKKPTIYAIWSDLFHEDVPVDFIDNVFKVMGFEAIHHTYLVLTKRPEIMAELLLGIESELFYTIHDNIYLGTTAENQKQADKRIPHLLKIPGKKFLSIEPLLEGIDLSNICVDASTENNLGDIRPFNNIDWVVVGAESGRKRRECKIEWIESIVEQCKEAGVPVFVKQIHLMGRFGANPLKLVTDINQFPESLRVRELPWRE